MKKKHKKIIIWALFILLIINVSVVICLSNFRYLAFNEGFYLNEYKKYDPDVANKEIITKNLLIYLRYKRAGPEYLTSFRNDEIDHMAEVRTLIHKFLLALDISIVLLIISVLGLIYIEKNKSIKRIGKSLISGGILTLIAMLILHIIVRIDFDKAWAKFHHIFFRLGNWSFPPEYNLVILFPSEFWIDIINKLVLMILISAGIIILAGILLIYINKMRRFKDVIREF